MQVLDLNKNKPKYTILAKVSKSYPKPNTFVTVDEELVQDFIDSANTILTETEDFLKTDLTTSHPKFLTTKTVFAPCIEETKTERKFPFIFKVKNVSPSGKDINIELFDPFNNTPKGMTFSFKDNQVTTVDLLIGYDTSTSTKSDKLNYIGYVNENGNEVFFEVIGKMPELMANNISKQCIKVFSKIFDLNGEIGEMQKNYEVFKGSAKMDNIMSPYDISRLPIEPFLGNNISQQNINTKPKIKVYDLRNVNGDERNFEEPNQESQKIPFNPEMVLNHPLHDYTEDLMLSMVNKLRDFGITLSINELTDLFEVGFGKMNRSQFMVVPDYDINEENEDINK
ncbi:hypothetical protein HYO65_gp270 [Tenacibaculum phage PTm1]|uniref:Uncharacterized protein n=2 Tax=Shirahamavirus PTm1 TaxID=2846435 RepID=A0A5S9EQN5_9CAUD|nr:hypothetical protein HYO65_gp270 [Tenacibaculum phage PTm1]BBI90662.1 hypothetical protein [Tenacibaculum phage PTm1]BBI90967.1 hypothetical protein [Tenacibaculum phage PTm5]